MNEEHLFRPSRLGLRALCPGSLDMERGLPSIDSEEAAEGRLLHAAMAAMSVDSKAEVPELTEEQSAAIEQAVSFEEHKLADIFGCDIDGVEFFEELPLEIRIGDDVIPGTADFLAIGNGKALLIDWKFGRNEPNPEILLWQMRAYALGVAQRFKVNEIHVYVYMPRLSLEKYAEFNKVRQMVSSIAGYLEGPIRSVIESSKRNVWLKAGDHCQWCRAKTNCSACAAFLNRETAIMKAEPPHLPAMPAQVVSVMRRVKAWRAIAEKVWDAGKAEIEREPATYAPLGAELVERQGNRYVADLREAVARLAPDVTAAQVIDIASVPFSKLEALAIGELAIDGVTKADAKREFESRLGDVIKRGKGAKVLNLQEES